ncbi:hypothetical protein [Streptomyces virginiae]
MHGLVVDVLAEVLGHRLVVEPVGGAAVLGGLDDVGACLTAQPEQVVVGAGAAGDFGGEGGPDVFPGQALTLGVGEGEQEVGGAFGMIAEALVEVVSDGGAGVAGQGGAPGRVAVFGDGGGGGEGACGDAGDEEGLVGGTGDNLCDRPYCIGS